MAFIRRAFLSLRRRYARTLLLFVILLVIGVFEAAGFLLSSAARSAKNETLRQIGVYISLSNNPTYLNQLDQQAIASGNVKTGSGSAPGANGTYTIPLSTPAEITDAMLAKVEKMPHMIGINYTTGGGTAIPLNFSNVKEHTGVDPSTQKVRFPQNTPAKDGVGVVGGARIDLTDIFRKKEAQIVQGAYPTDQNPGALIEERLAAKNNLKLGDTIRLASAHTNESSPISLKIVGIYRTTEKFIVLDTNPSGEGIYAGSPYNRIFTDYKTSQTIFGEKTRMTVDIYLDSPDNLDSAAARIKKLDFDWNKYAISPSSVYYSGLLDPLHAMSAYALAVNLVTTCIGAVILLLVMSLWSKHYVYEAGLLLSLGEKKWKIVAGQVTEVLVVASAAFTIAAFVGLPIAQRLGGQAEPQIADTGSATTASFDTGSEITRQTAEIRTDAREVAGVAGSGILLVLVATAVPGVLILRYQPRSILSKSE